MSRDHLGCLRAAASYVREQPTQALRSVAFCAFALMELHLDVAAKKGAAASIRKHHGCTRTEAIAACRTVRALLKGESR